MNDTWHLPGGLLGRFLRSLLGGSVAYFTLFVIVHAVLAFTTAGATWFDVLELVLICAPQGVLALHRRMNTGVLILSAVGLVLAAPSASTRCRRTDAGPGTRRGSSARSRSACSASR